jgi:hypothetical protein
VRTDFDKSCFIIILDTDVYPDGCGPLREQLRVPRTASVSSLYDIYDADPIRMIAADS